MSKKVIDPQHASTDFKLNEVEHCYGDNIHILSSPFTDWLLAKLCTESVKLPSFNLHLRRLYQYLLQNSINHLFETEYLEVETRMQEFHPAEAQLKCRIPKLPKQVVIACLARAGVLPSQECFEELCHFDQSDQHRIDYININRQSDSSGSILGSHIHSSKIGGEIDQASVFIPDPMGATGSTIAEVIKLYESLGNAKNFIALHLIITPEYIRKLQSLNSKLHVYCLRVDRSLSDASVLQKKPGEDLKAEIGLNKQSYIVPGAGGIGEILTNSFV